MIILLVALAAVVGAPMAAALLVTFASLREDSAHSLTGQPPGVLARIARRILRVPTGTGHVSATRLVLRPAVRRHSGLHRANKRPLGRSSGTGSVVAAAPVPRPRLAPDEQQPAAPTLTMPRP